MSDSTRLGRARGKMLPVAILAAALVVMLVVAPLASAASDPIKSGTTTLTINSGFNKKAKKAGIKITAVKPSKIKGTKATFAVTGGEIEPATGAGSISHSGGLKITWGKKSVTLKSFTVDTTKKSLSAKVGGKTVKVASLAGTSTARLGFGATVSAKKVKLTKAGAKALNSKLTPAPTKTKVKKNGKTIVKTVKVKPPFKANMVLGASNSEVEPETVVVAPTGTMTFTGAAGLLSKLAAAEVKLEVIPPTTATSLTTFVSPISGGTISPLGTSGSVTSSGGLKLTQSFALNGLNPPQPNESTSITLANIGVDLAAKTGGVEVIGESNFKEPGTGKEPLKLGNLGRSSIADLTITATPSPATRTVTVSASGTIQAVATEALNGFIKVHQIKKTEDYSAEEGKKAFEESGGKISPEEAAKIGLERGTAKAAAEAKALEIKAGEPLGTFSFVATGQ
jgi:hypothetical protein